MTYPGFVPFTSFDPLDGDDPRITLSHDNPCRVENTPHHLSKRHSAKTVGVDTLNHGRKNHVR